MFILDTSLKSLEIKLSGSVTTNQLPWVSSWVLLSTVDMSIIGTSENDGVTNNATAVQMIPPPSASQSIQLKALSVFNADTVPATVVIQINNNTTKRIIWQGTLAVGDTLNFVY